jgi:hypothetical protein
MPPVQQNPPIAVAVVGDKPCIYCGYNLQGLSAQDPCPHCGKIAGHSLLGDHLRDVDSQWIRNVMVGINLITIGYVVLALVRLLQLAVAVGFHNVAFDTTALRFCTDVVGWITFTVGVIMITLPETSGSLIARKRGVAATLRVATVVAAVMTFVPVRWFAAHGPQAEATHLVVGSLAMILCNALLWLHLRKIIDRTPRREVRALLTLCFAITLPLFVLICPGVIHLLGHHVLSEEGAFMAGLTVQCLAAVHHFASSYPLQVTRKAILRTVGYWGE